MEENVGENIKNAFFLVSETFKECSFFLQDFKKYMVDEKDFKDLLGDSGVQTKTSNSIEEPEDWMPRWVSAFFNKKEQKEIFPLLSLTLSFLGLNDKGSKDKKEVIPVTPVVILGLSRGMNHEKAKHNWQHGWFDKIFWNQDSAFKYDSIENENLVDIESPNKHLRKMIRFSCKYGDDSYAWPKKGVFWADSLVEIKDYDQIRQLGDRANEIWNKYSDSDLLIA